jgi:hypothetical protein
MLRLARAALQRLLPHGREGFTDVLRSAIDCSGRNTRYSYKARVAVPPILRDEGAQTRTRAYVSQLRIFRLNAAANTLRGQCQQR